MEKTLKSKITVAVMIAVLCCTALLSLIFAGPVQRYGAEGQTNGLRFKQVAVGSDFALALTYDGGLYGWDITEMEPGVNNALGTRYGTSPKRLNVQLVKGPRYSDGSDIIVDNTADPEDYITNVAATSSTAAFITAKGNIYTFGANKLKNSAGYGTLLRKITGETDPNPALIDYACDTNVDIGMALRSMSRGGVYNDSNNPVANATKRNNDDELYDITGSDDNFVIKHRRSGGSGVDVFYFGWGSSQYLTTPTTAFAPDSVKAGVYGFAGPLPAANDYTMSLGGGTLLLSAGDSVYIRGKNYYIPAGKDSYVYNTKTVNQIDNTPATDGVTYDVLYLENILDLDATGQDDFTFTDQVVKVKGALSGGTDTFYYINEALANGSMTGGSLPYDFYKAKDSKSVSGSLITFKNSSPSFAGIDDKATTMSMGNGYGYLISGAQLYFFGNGYNGQSGTAAKSAYPVPTAVSGFTGIPVAVAAGKTRMGNPLFGSPLSEGITSVGGGKLELTAPESGKLAISNFGDCVDGTEFLSGLITKSDGKNSVYVWNSEKGFTSIGDKFEALGVTGNDANKIVNLYSGYGNRLMALSSLGKIYQITYNGGAFDVELKDEFLSADGSKVANYTVNNGNKLNFAISNGRPGTAGETQSTSVFATLDINSLTSSEAAMAANTVYQPVIAGNNSGDAYRILLGANDNSLVSRAIVSDKLVGSANVQVNDGGGLHFYFKDDMTAEIPAEILKHYLDYTVNEADGKISVTVTPYQSTKDKTIVMQYYVGRYDTYVNENLSASSGAFKFYDYALVSTEITIANTAANYKYFDNKTGSAQTDNISIPVLDPNNKLNNTYSIALTDVQFGLQNLAAYFGLSGDNLKAFNDYVVSAVYENDPGFPASKKVTDGYLERYYDEAGSNINYKWSTYYNDRYQFMAFDPDGDKLNIETPNEMSSAGTYFDCAKSMVSLLIPLSGSGFDISNISEITLKNFNNIYNLSLAVTQKDGSSYLSVSYDVARLTAKKSTGNLEYADSDISKPLANKNVDALPRYSLSLSETYYDAAQAADKTVFSEYNSPIVPAYIQASMITNKTAPDGQYYRSEEGYNEFVFAAKSTTVGAKTEIERVYTLNLASSGLFDDYTNIYFTHKKVGDDGVTYTDYGQSGREGGFVGQFDNTLFNVSLDKQTLKFEAKTPGLHRFAIDVYRFTNSDMNQPILSNGKEAEFLRLYFEITAGSSAFENTNLKQLTTQTVNKETAYSIESFTEDRDTVFTSVMSSNDGIATIKLSDDRKKFIITPVSSGQVTVLYNIKQYAEPKGGSFIANIESRSVLPKTISLTGSETIYLSDFMDVIGKDYKGEDGFKSSEYSLDKTDANAPEGFYFVKLSVNEETGLNEWVSIEQPDFINRVAVVQNDKGKDTAIELGLGNNYDNKVNYDNIMLVVKFAGINGKKFEGAIKVTPTKKFLLADDGGELNMNVDVKGEVGTDTNQPRLTGEGTYIIPMKYLTDRADISSNTYNVMLVTAVETAYDFFNISNIGNDIIIKPNRSTPVKQTVNVTVSDYNTPYVLTFYVSVSGIIEVLPKATYVTVWLACSISVFALLFIIFIIRMGVYWKKKAEQKRIIKKNQMLIKMRDKVHNKTEAVSKEQIVQTKLKMEDPKYAKMFNEMKKTTEERTGITLDNSTVARKAEAKTKAIEKTKKKKGGKKSIEELKAELAAKKEAFAKMQMSEDIADVAPEQTFSPGYSDGMSREDIENQINEKINSDDNILFDVETLDDDNK